MSMKFVSAVLSATAITVMSAPAAQAASAPPVRNIVLVHGAWVDGSGWKPVYEILTKHGYNVTLVQQPLTSLEDDVAATRRVIALQPGPTILVSHSYGGTVITEAGNDPKVAGLVYIASHQPDAGESEGGNGKPYPTPTSRAKAIQTTPDGFTFLDPALFPKLFAPDLPRAQAEFEARAQMLTSAKVFTTPVTSPAWKVKPSWALVAGADQIISPDLERMYAKRAHSKVVEVPGASHSVYESRPKEVAALIEDAATHALDEATQ
ncbi:MAG TPA: alpha/beta hydrolase [Sphingomicrobium sp.]|nr:alpha/beta hydrolase [Sphingomicrobium sp.]